MNMKSSATDRRLSCERRLTRLSDDELSHVVGGSIWSSIKSAARWVKNHVFVDGKNKVVGVKGTL